ncbi:tripartite tricarboxylate transporter permease [Candidatus Woesearchaeota archaeon]|nr:tripartite tricarboxylate transporter permease [Candidatus Woesearchaeota archaeon]
MFFQLFLGMLAGITAGIITGLIPGIHVNLISVFLVSASAYLLGLTSPLILAVFIISMAITHTFLDSIPSIFLGAPDTAMALGVLPGHRLLLEGKGYEAVKLTVIGSLLALIATLFLIPFMLPLVPKIYSFIQPYIAHILILVVLYMILKEKGLNKIFWGSFVFFISGILGIIVLGWHNLGQPLFPLLSGLFGVSTLLTSLSQNVEIPKQHITESIKVSFTAKVKAIGAAVFSGSLTGLLPGLGSAQAAIIAMQLVGDIGNHAFMILIGGINTVNFTFSLVTFYTLKKARNGAVVAILEILKSISLEQLLLFLLIALVAGCIAAILSLFFARIFSRLIVRVNYKALCIGIISFISLMVIYFSGIIGLLILITSTAIGIIPSLIGVKRSHAMGCLLLPVILFFIL